ncbi:hypothetical protein D8B26_002549 [Coccidioides posadasii str. Silveira]|uniref:Uncharacterized protein n=1 Tax=Coccidioides posadasii (strain RMSCC 757 / Silveira) TaxID=443226 RepID=E9DIV6_COCPS|nr:conserved hypothetical protein [Coccidioides posadasii str. Silveira]QVM07855.1 hypothetical protein D8B26_002549 [Coccidioides posadasii str. Silveira]
MPSRKRGGWPGIPVRDEWRRELDAELAQSAVQCEKKRKASVGQGILINSGGLAGHVPEHGERGREGRGVDEFKARIHSVVLPEIRGRPARQPNST